MRLSTLRRRSIPLSVFFLIIALAESTVAQDTSILMSGPTTETLLGHGESYQIYLPVISASGLSIADRLACAFGEQETQLEERMRSHPAQQRLFLRCNAKLSSVAHARAADMGRRSYLSHVNPDGFGPNYLVRETGYVLPTDYGTELASNNVESIGAGPSNADGMWNAWMKSEKHTTHLLGQNSFFAEQIEYGIGFAEVAGSPYEFYWVFISAKPESHAQ